MIDPHKFLLFFAAAFVLAITPGAGIFYVLARTLAGGRREGVESPPRTFVGGLFHVMAAAMGVSAILAASAGGMGEDHASTPSPAKPGLPLLREKKK